MSAVIYRSTRQKLYLFQKTLKETGQSVMAAAVPVKLTKRTVGHQDTALVGESDTPATTSDTYIVLDEEREDITSDERVLVYHSGH